MRATPIILAFLLVFSFCNFAHAEFYKYVDKHGNVIYTDDINQIPADQRENATTYDESYSNAEPEKPKTESAPEKSSDLDAIEEERRELEGQKKVLDKEFEELKSTRSELDEAKANAVTPEQIKAYNQRIIDFNTRAKAHQEKLDAYTKQVNSYNERLKESENQKEE